MNKRAACPRKARTFKQVAIHFANTGMQTSPSQALHMLFSMVDSIRVWFARS
jgi:hypothetical protein